MKKFIKVFIMGSQGRDYFNLFEYYKYRAECRVVAFTTSPQIALTVNDIFPTRLAGDLYPDGIPIRPESELIQLMVKEFEKEDTGDVIVNFAYSDVSQSFMDDIQDRVEFFGGKFVWDSILGETMIKSTKSVIAITAVRTGCGKSAVTRYVLKMLKGLGKRVVAIRHPMPYGDLNNSNNDVQRFASLEDLDFHNCTFEEREEYEPIINSGFVVYAGIDYRKILEKAEKEADVIIWDGGNNDVPFYKPDLWITIVDPHRPGDEMKYPHGRYNLKNADVVLINKVSSANSDKVECVVNSVFRNRKLGAKVFKIDLEITISDADADFIRGKRVIAVEDGPTLTHGGMSYGAAVLAAKKYGCELVNPYDYALDYISETFIKYPHLKDAKLLPNMGYSYGEIIDLERTINYCVSSERVDAVLSGTPIDLSRVLNINVPIVPVKYEAKFMSIISEKHFASIIREVTK